VALRRSAAQQISLSYLEQLFGKLRPRARREHALGRGYSLGRKADQITWRHHRRVDEPIDATGCAGKETAWRDSGRCMTHDLWASLNTR